MHILLLVMLVLWGIVILMTYIKVAKIDKSIPRRVDGCIDRRFGKRDKSIIIPPETKVIENSQIVMRLEDDGGLL